MFEVDKLRTEKRRLDAQAKQAAAAAAKYGGDAEGLLRQGEEVGGLLGGYVGREEDRESSASMEESGAIISWGEVGVWVHGSRLASVRRSNYLVLATLCFQKKEETKPKEYRLRQVSVGCAGVRSDC